jgi:CBS domain-containing protein
MTLCARDFMQKDVLTLSPETPLLGAHRFFVEEEIHGAPVVEDDGKVIGVVSTLDLLRAVEEEHERGSSAPSYFRDTLEFSSPSWPRVSEDFQDRLNELTVRDIMNPELVAVSADASAPEVARAFTNNRVHRVLVLDGGKLLGLISTFDLVGLIESGF